MNRTPRFLLAWLAGPAALLLMPAQTSPNRHLKHQEVGLHDATLWSCKFVYTINPFVDTCEGFPEQPTIGSSSGVDVVRWLGKIDWYGKPQIFKRADINGGKVDRTIEAVVGPTNYQLRDLGSRPLIIARITADPSSTEDKAYHIGAPRTNGKWQHYFYVVVDRFTAPPSDQPIKYDVARWRVIGINGSGKLEEVATGRLQYCSHQHDKKLRKLGAYFATCEGAEALSLATHDDPVINSLGGIAVVLERLRSGSLVVDPATRIREFAAANRVVFTPVVAQALAKFLYDTEVEPAWLVCGLGCCSVEF